MTTAPRPGAAGHRRPALGLLVLVAAVVLGVVLLPSATRPPKPVVSTSAASTTTAPTTKAAASSAASTTTTTTVPPGAVHVLVANGTTVPHGAGAVASYLSSKGFGTLPAADATSSQISSSEVYVVNGADPVEGQQVASVLGLPATDVVTTGAPPVATVAGATVVVIVGPQLARRHTTATSTGSSTG
jgi:hypothetical protein